MSFLDKTNNWTMSKIQFLSVCHYITSLGVIFSNKGLITMDQRNQTVPVFNAFFQCLNESSNATETRIYLLNQVFNFLKIKNESNLHKEVIKEQNLEMKYVNETYQYIINAGLFAHYGNIIGYLSGIKNGTSNETIFALRETVSKELSENYISSNLCSLQNATYRLTPLAIDNLFKNYVRPIIQAHRGKNLENGNALMRSKRQPSKNDYQEYENALNVYLSDFQFPDENQQLEINAFFAENNAAQEDVSRHIDTGVSNNNNSVIDNAISLDDNYVHPVKIRKTANFEDDNSDVSVLHDLGVHISGASKNFGTSKYIPGTSRYIPETLGDDLPSTSRDALLSSKIIRDYILGTSGGASSSIDHPHSQFERKKSLDYNFADTLRELRNNKLSIKQNKDHMKKFRIDLNNLAIEQTDEKWVVEPIELWYSEITDRGNVIEFLRNLTGAIFFFNDITLLTNANGSELPWETWKVDPLGNSEFIYMVYYLIKVNSHHGFVHLKSKNYQNLYFTFPDVLFIVQHTKISTNGNKIILIMYLMSYSLERQAWNDNRKNELKSLTTIEKGKSRRMQSIEKAADLITSIVPMHTFQMSVNILKGYILKLKESPTSVPTYEELAWDLCNNLKISASYNEWKIPRNPLIEEVLFETDFDTSMSYMDLLTKMHGSFKQNYLRFNENDYNKYKNTSLLRRNLRIEDYFILIQFLQRQLKYSIKDNSKKRLFVALFRLALKVCEEEWIANNITVYQVKYERFPLMLSKELNSGRNYTLKNIEEFSSHHAVEEYKLRIMNTERNYPVWMEMEFLNQVGMVNIDRLFNRYTGSYYILPQTFPVSEHRFTPIVGKYVLFIKVEDKRLKESKMIEIIEKLDGILREFPNLFHYYN